ncbi:ABC transporter permease [Methanoplanus sp. FWC-SCC4]|uniref:ABC transporter permease n=1 Tax=Methanochimaera problematica TaxID=2609417 RepID=A0AA97I336_9EURY|nr:ABC transporter permease [Methanoplanus sp. FWC-SCC4]WOF16258.1 ABC transporter permease [Methanoplanus sp. FWC-SCC4]
MAVLMTIWGAAVQQILLVYTALLISVVLGIFLAVISLYSKIFAKTIMTFANLAQAVPTFAIVAIVVPLIGIGFWPAIIAIMLRALLPIVKNTWIGLSDIDYSLIDSGMGSGLTDWQIIKYIRFPYAYPAIFSGVKFAAILANSIAILTAIIGSGGLGSIIFEGLANMNISKMMSAVIPAIIIALFLEFSLTYLEKKVVSPGLTQDT